jgi:hypothetical protein
VATAVVVIVNTGEVVAPAATVTEIGRLATVGSLLDRSTTAPPAGACPFNVTVLFVVDLPPTTEGGESFTEVNAAGFTVSVSDFVLVPSLALIVTWVVVATAVVVMVNGAETVAPPATVTEGGTVATAGSVLLSVMVAPLAGAADVSFTVFAVVDLPPTTDAGERASDDSATLLSEKLVERPYSVAVTVYEPAAAFAFAVTLALPSDPVTALVDDKVALAPEAGAAKVTVTPLMGEP